VRVDALPVGGNLDGLRQPLPRNELRPNHDGVRGCQIRDPFPPVPCEHRMLCGPEEWSRKPFDRDSVDRGLSESRIGDDVGDHPSAQIGDRPQGIARAHVLHGLRGSVREQNRRTRRMAEPVTSGRGNTEDLRTRAVVHDGFFLDRVHVARDYPTVHVQPELPVVDAAHPAEPDLALADLAVPGARRAHDLVRALDGFPELSDLPRRVPGRLPDIEGSDQVRLRRHRTVTQPKGVLNTFRAQSYR